ncbi:MAG TPA: carbohydrate kinase family protein, partial [Gemmatimonadaceae bacterium]
MRLSFAIPPSSTHTFDVVTLGLNSVDMIAVVPEYPARNSKQHLEEFVRLPGGQMATAAATCARLGWRSRYVGAFGDDELSVFGRRSLTDEGVDVSAAWDVPGATSQFAVVIVDRSTGERTVLWNRHEGLDIAP